jgi:signal transduction histidine kinase
MLAPRRSTTLICYLLASISLLLATGLRFLLDDFLGDHLSFSFYFLAVSIVAWTGGIWPAFVTALISCLIGNYFFSHPQGQLVISDSEEFYALALFLVVSLVIGLMSETSLRALERAKAAERAKDDFMATVAHELRSPLSVIQYANTLSRFGGDDEMRDNIEIIDQQVYRLNLLIEDLLDLSRVANGKVRLNRKNVDASDVVSDALEKVRPLIDQRNHSLIVNIAAEPMPLHVDPLRIEQILTNLLTNAAKYTNDGGKIQLTVAPIDERVLFTIRDNGIGISAETLPRIFNLFTQSEPATKRAEGGLGIGLSVVRKLVELHGGSVTASSDGLNHGSEFVVSLPLEPAKRPKPVLVSKA